MPFKTLLSSQDTSTSSRMLIFIVSTTQQISFQTHPFAMLCKLLQRPRRICSAFPFQHQVRNTLYASACTEYNLPRSFTIIFVLIVLNPVRYLLSSISSVQRFERKRARRIDTVCCALCVRLCLHLTSCSYTCRSPKACANPDGSYAGVFAPLSINSRTCKFPKKSGINFFLSLFSNKGLLIHCYLRGRPNLTRGLHRVMQPLYRMLFSREQRCCSNQCDTFKSNSLLQPGDSDSDCSSHSINSSCVVSKCRQHSAFLADAFSPAIECLYQSKRGSCVFQVSNSNARVWPVRVHAWSCVQSC